MKVTFAVVHHTSSARYSVLSFHHFLVSLLLVTVLTVLLLRRYRVKLHAVFKLHPFDRDECEGEGMIYDVFISSCEVDRGRTEEILNQLELNRCQTCYHLRDFLPGRSNHGKHRNKHYTEQACVVYSQSGFPEERLLHCGIFNGVRSGYKDEQT